MYVNPQDGGFFLNKSHQGFFLIYIRINSHRKIIISCSESGKLSDTFQPWELRIFPVISRRVITNRNYFICGTSNSVEYIFSISSPFRRYYWNFPKQNRDSVKTFPRAARSGTWLGRRERRARGKENKRGGEKGTRGKSERVERMHSHTK